ncbi:MAG: lipocalin family protein [Bacteroidota bacterium]
MKKTILTAVVSILLTSCGKDDGNTPTQDPIIGTWQLEQTFTNDVSDDISDCEKQSTIEYKADGSYEASDKFDPEMGSACVEDNYTGTWENKGDNAYDIFTTGEDGAVTFTITFSDGKLTRQIDDERYVYISIN